ncbi:Arm DNA-binding domain-containing protein [Alkalilacustris brevis]|uniref:Arm DNA-binding domain-containing protein n=1 Tax=Alkalilacustris brevis TaxID=2026338 RepID=UPI003B75D052
MALSEFALRKAKPRDKAYKLAEGSGLHVLVQPSGSKLWWLKKRFGARRSSCHSALTPDHDLQGTHEAGRSQTAVAGGCRNRGPADIRIDR